MRTYKNMRNFDAQNENRGSKWGSVVDEMMGSDVHSLH